MPASDVDCAVVESIAGARARGNPCFVVADLHVYKDLPITMILVASCALSLGMTFAEAGARVVHTKT